MSSETNNGLRTNTLNRRRFLQVSTGGLIEIAARSSVPTVATLSTAVVSPAAPLREVSTDRRYPGDLEDKSKSSLFIDPLNKGFHPLLKNVVFSAPQIAEGVRGTFETAERDISQSKPVGFGELFSQNYTLSLNRLTQAHAEGAPINPQLEAAHEAVYVMAAFGTIAWFSLNEGKRLGVIPQDVSPRTRVDQVVWGESGLGTRLYPRFFGSRGVFDPPGLEPANKGKERTMHVAAHTLITFLYRYLSDINHPLSGAFPNMLRSEITIRRTLKMLNSAADEAALLSHRLGWGHEFQGSFLSAQGISKTLHSLATGQPTREGLRDLHYSNDTAANNLGAAIGNVLFEQTQAGQDPTKLFRAIDHPRFKRKETSAKVDLINFP